MPEFFDFLKDYTPFDGVLLRLIGIPKILVSRLCV